MTSPTNLLAGLSQQADEGELDALRTSLAQLERVVGSQIFRLDPVL